jgi:hypothetical protein
MKIFEKNEKNICEPDGSDQLLEQFFNGQVIGKFCCTTITPRVLIDLSLKRTTITIELLLQIYDIR